MSADQAPDGRFAVELTRRGIEDVLHFTTSHGLLGILTLRELRARAHLASDDYLEHVYRPNAASRYEAPVYWRYVNMSVTDVNGRFFGISQRWHAREDGLFWAILHFDPAILAHPDVLFSPGNMGYQGMTPAAGFDGFTSLFAGRVPYGYGKTVTRPADRSVGLPTNPQAEVLYPDQVSTEFLTRVTVADDDFAASVEAIVGAIDHPEVDVVVDSDLFRR
ncbi:DarT ssDNA thymidine ADP-ribosyltransferase family protein [Phycicoccus flavus]|uniref:DarT ssDNA thymidine ADP-ribosyltransferase family protein n=1 Tax=Phycicoccus flavus TaxID=2502783 RepID=UPI000FEBF7E4|nr:DarT ssDNA thymidine ADP-ribosyltransferase family protein [Phycicoccus flavus]NHA68767.1 DUF4433 domain-containing protein [Phycicoccus flavus]